MVHEFTHKLYIFFVFVVKICRMGLSDFLYLSVRRPIYPGVKNEKKRERICIKFGIFHFGESLQIIRDKA